MVTTYVTPSNVRRELLAEIRARGHEVTVVAPEPDELMRPSLAHIGGEYVRWPIDRTRIDPIGDARSVGALLKILCRQQPDVVLCYQIKAVLLAPFVARLAGVRRCVVLVNGLGTVFDDSAFAMSWPARVTRVAYRFSIRAADCIVFHNSDDVRQLLDRNILGRSSHWRVVPGSGIDMTKFTVAAPASDPPTFTLTARMLKAKGVREFVSAARILKRTYPNARFILAGQVESNHPDAVSQAELSAWTSEGLITYRGFVEDVRELLGSTTVYVLPSYHEGMPRTNLEAMAMGLPVVTTNVSGCRETVNDGVNGYLVPARDSVALAQALERYLTMPNLAATHGRESRRMVERFRIEHINAAMVDVLGLS